MNFGLAAATFAVVIPAELPDKTFVSSIILSSRYRPLPVWVGASSGLVLQAAVAVVAGRLLALAPRTIVDGVVAAAFFAGAIYLFCSRTPDTEQEGRKMAQQGERAGGGDETTPQAQRSFVWIAATTFGIVALAEFGDLTQVVVANLAARTRQAPSVFAGAAVAFILISAAGVAAGRTVTRFIPLAAVRKLSAAVLAGLGVWSALAAAGV